MMLERMADRNVPFTLNGSRERLAHAMPFCYTTAKHFNSVAFVAWWPE